jgi:hypothetical protein
MPSHEVVDIDQARIVLERVIAERELSKNPVSYFAPTDVSFLEPSRQDADKRLRHDTELSNRSRAAVYMCLTAAAAALQVCVSLMDENNNVSAAEREENFASLADDAQAAGEAACQAGMVLIGKDSPEVDESIEVKLL